MHRVFTQSQFSSSEAKTVGLEIQRDTVLPVFLKRLKTIFRSWFVIVSFDCFSYNILQKTTVPHNFDPFILFITNVCFQFSEMSDDLFQSVLCMFWFFLFPFYFVGLSINRKFGLSAPVLGLSLSLILRRSFY